MARVQLLSFSSGVIEGSSGPFIKNASCLLYTHGTTTQVTIYAAETGTAKLTQPQLTDSNGRIAGWVEEGQRLDVLCQGVTTPLEASAGRTPQPRGPVFTPEQYDAKGDLTLFTDGAIQSGSTTLTSAAITAPIAALMNAAFAAGAPMHIYVDYAGAGTTLGTTSAQTGVASISSIARTAGAASVLGPVIISSGANAQLFNCSAAGGANAAITVNAEVPYFNFPIGSALSYGNTGLSTTISAASVGSITLAAPASQTVQKMVGWFGTDDTAAFLLALTALNNAGGGTLLLGNTGYLVDGAPLSTGGGNAILPLPLLTLGSVAILGAAGTTSANAALSFVNGAIAGTVIATTRLSDTYSAAHGAPSMIGGPTYEGTGNTSQNPQIAMLRVEDLMFLKPENPSIGSLDSSLVARTEHRRCYTQTAAQINRAAYNFTGSAGAGYGQMGQVPSHAWNFGFWLPDSLNFNQTICSECGATGDLAPFVVSAHTELDNCFAQFCTAGIGCRSNLNGASVGVHLNALNRFGIFACNYGLVGWDPVNGITSLPAAAAPVTFEGSINWESDRNQWALTAPTLDANGRIRMRVASHEFDVFAAIATPISSAGMVVHEVDPLIYVPTYDDIVLADTPLAYIKLHEPTGTAAVDLSGNGHSGTHTAAPLLGLSGPLVTDHSVAYNGTSQYTLLDTLGTLGANIGTSTIEFWVRISGTGNTGTILGSTNGTTGTVFEITANHDNTNAVNAGKTLIALSDQGAAHHRRAHITTNIYDGNWHYVVVQPSVAGTHAVWVDGIAQTVTMETTPGTLVTLANFANGMTIGAVNNTGTFGIINFLAGRVAKVGFYTTQLTLAKLLNRWQWALRLGR